MNIGVLRERKAGERRVALLPNHVGRLVRAGHKVVIEKDAGLASGAADSLYEQAGALVVPFDSEVTMRSELIVGVKEPLPYQYDLIDGRHIIVTNLHTAMNRPLTDRLLESGCTSISIEECHVDGSANCAIAGEVGAFEGVRLALAHNGGTGRHFMPHFGVRPLRAVVFGIGQVGRGAIRTLLRLGCSVVALNRTKRTRDNLKLQWTGADLTVDDIAARWGYLLEADLIVNAVLWDKTRTDHLISIEELKQLKPTAVIADLSCDEGGGIESCVATTWANPTYLRDGIAHFCVANIPATVPVTASQGYADTIIDQVHLIADVGAVEACRQNMALRIGFTTHQGKLYFSETADIQKRDLSSLTNLMFPPKAIRSAF